jgi:hypothetical protein
MTVFYLTKVLSMCILKSLRIHGTEDSQVHGLNSLRWQLTLQFGKLERLALPTTFTLVL